MVEVPDDLPLIEMDPIRIREVLVNLITNALRHTPKGGKVTIWGQIDDGYAQITVEDTGSGIAPEDLDHIFDRFYKAAPPPTISSDRAAIGTGASSPARSAPKTGASSPARSAAGTSGSGLGLTIAKNLVTAHGGEITAESTLGQGTVVRFTLPLAVNTI
jgi:signal transduction histidine kinase